MSRLRELRLHGFKTFADPTRFVFERGVTAVIGPNGSGKSNMADAVRWVLGEQSNRSLRTRRADDVIFAGSQQRKAQGMAEAILTLDNADGWLPIEFSEVTVGRRAYRSGESEYLINGARARLRDVVELLGEGRLGANELVVVGQGTVDAALSLRPEERRQLFEEAAGVKNLQVRKNEALARLARANDNLARLTDLIAELRPQVRRLAQQAQHQQEHDTLRSHAHALVHESHRRREVAARGALGEARRRAAAAEAELEAFRAQQAQGRAAVEAAERHYWDADAAARAAATRREASREAVIRAEGRLEALLTRRAELAARLEREQAELDAARTTLESLTSSQQDGALAALLSRAAQAEAAWREASATLAAADSDLLAAEEALAAIRHRRSAALATEARRAEELAAAVARRERIDREHETTRLAGEEATLAAATASEALRAAAAAEEASRARLTAAREAHERAEQELSEARRALSELSERHDATGAQLRALEERAEAGNEVAAALVSDGWQPLIAALDAPDEAWPAIEAVIGGELSDALLWRDASRDGSMDERISGRRGSVRLLSPTVAASSREEALSAVGATQTLAEWIGRVDAPALLHRVVVAADAASLLRGWPQLPAGWLAVTRDGDVADGRGLITLRGRASAPGGAAARDHARRRELGRRLEELASELAAAERRMSEAQAGVETSRAELARERQAHDDDERRLRQARATAEAAEHRQARLARDVARLSDELSRARTVAAELDTRQPVASGDDDDTERLAEAAAAARAAREQALAVRDRSREAWQAAREAADAAEARDAGARRERLALESRIQQLDGGLPAARQAAAALDDEIAQALAHAERAQAEDATASEERAAADRNREEQRAALLELERASHAGDRLAELERAAHGAAIDVSRHEEVLSGLQRERELALESFAGSDADAFTASAEESRAAAALDDDSLEAELRRVRRTLGQIGSVNPFAVEEHRQLAERLSDLETQDGDLRNASGSTQELIVTLDAEIAERFNLAFTAIGARFDEFCRLLFAGGSASLQMGEADDGGTAAGIEIVVQPPGKRPQRLGMLSGGERALTGVALLFAMLSVNPVPFCVLDEVDAALDEANIGRFADALRRLAETIDFVVITHNRATMEVADTIYGVTMTDAAVSRVLSLRLADLPVADMPAEVSA
jgi:chromosome segregation protein